VFFQNGTDVAVDKCLKQLATSLVSCGGPRLGLSRRHVLVLCRAAREPDRSCCCCCDRWGRGLLNDAFAWGSPCQLIDFSHVPLIINPHKHRPSAATSKRRSNRSATQQQNHGPVIDRFSRRRRITVSSSRPVQSSTHQAARAGSSTDRHR